jgi:multidrug resistance efflux pump
VRRGDLLAEMDATPEQLQLREQEVKIDGLDPQIARSRRTSFRAKRLACSQSKTDV